MRRILFSFLFCLVIFQITRATTWNEPWQDEVIRLSDSFIKVKITENKGSQATAEVIKVLAGNETSKTIELKGYSILRLSSVSAREELTLPFSTGASYYLFVKKDEQNQTYQIPTPTSGWDFIKDKNVNATYRHSYHKALVPEEIYEKTMQAIFNGIKGKPFDEDFITKYVKEQLSQKVGTLTDNNDVESQNRFFLQHVALETFFYLGKGANLSLLLPFLASSEAHAQISACRAISKINSSESKETLMKFIEGKGNNFAKVMAVWGLKRLEAKEMSKRLATFVKDGIDERTGFGGNIMDPRVGTYFPDSVKNAVKVLLEEWNPSKNNKPSS